jgi:hypothetical protein
MLTTPVTRLVKRAASLQKANPLPGSTILSSPGEFCMRCMGFLSDEKLAQEAARYGNVGGRPQVVWPNGVLASTAVGLAVDLVTNWTRSIAHTHTLQAAAPKCGQRQNRS